MPQPPQKRRPAWLMPTLAAALVVLVAAGGVGAYLLYGQRSGGPAPSGTRSSSPAQQPASAAKAPDVCAMLPKEEAERLVPGATVSRSSRDSDYTVNFGCNWINQRISFGEFWRSREIDVKVEQHKGEGAKTGRAMAQTSYEMEYRGGKYGETAKPSLDPDEKEYVSPVKDVQGVGDAAFAQYTWRRDGKLLWYAFGTAHARVGDMTIEVKFQAGQQRKDAQILSNESAQAVTEANAIREVSGLIGHFAKGVAAWQASNPGVLAKAEPSAAATVSPTVSATPSPTVLASFPAECQAVTETATRLVPQPATRARGTAAGADTQTECRWLNRELSGGPGVTKIRSVLITVHRFTNRAGAADEAAAKAFYASEYGRTKTTAKSSIGGITWGALTDVKGLGDQAYQQYVQSRSGEVSASSGSVIVRKGPVVIQVDYSGHQRPKDKATNSPEVVMMPEKEAMAGALTVIKAYLEKSAG
ncbi:hypothetical protein BKM31_28935 [[Actinomadura] parvosata subsp. kistnae]|uniref:DUF3558 domain-containing protein n=1 Tax=[Actinomadura] parvosata subsp. kistnae TaxID=1909395 RepID=A0A1V0A3Z6_9ACTN|nr:hypothetical protein [Nonomuraea sp. ATCC 55076]AQZ64936.1 hypothetical protein BKM31_28935 [Nonomuraea sp. ATCC 55076]